MKAWSLVLSKEVSVTKEGDHYVDQDGNFWNDFELACLQEDTNWQHYHIQAAISAMQGMIISDAYSKTEVANDYTGEKRRVKWDENKIAKAAITHADALMAELKHNDDVFEECRKLSAINTAAMCENMTKLQNEFQKKGGEK